MVTTPLPSRPPPRRRERLTGATRGRPRLLLPSLILQVEVVIESAPWASQIPAPWHPTLGISERAWLEQQAAQAAGAWKPALRYWRDARWDDQLELDRMELSATLRRRIDDPPPGEEVERRYAPSAPSAPSDD